MFRHFALLALAFLPSIALAQISDDFESGWDQTKWPIYAPDCNQGGTVSLDSTTAHSGKNSLKVTSPGGYCGHIFFGSTAVPTGPVYVKVWLKAQTALTSNHVSFITMPDAAQAAGKHLRIGGQMMNLMYNRESDDATLPEQSPQGVATSKPLIAGTWECFEYMLGTDGSIQTWLNSALIPGMCYPNNPNSQGWSQSTIIPKVTGVYFGWESYGGDVNTFWYDDVSISSTRVGCGASPPPPVSTTAATSAPPTTMKTMSTTSVVVKPTTTSSAIKTSTTSAVKVTTSSMVVVKSTTTSSAKTSTTATSGGPAVQKYGQCGGIGWTGSTTCAAGSTCQVGNPYYSQCL